MNEWISVKDRLPQKDGYVLAWYGFVKDGNMSKMRWASVLDYYAYEESPHFQSEGYHGLTVTHWMPLPPPPVEPAEIDIDDTQGGWRVEPQPTPERDIPDDWGL